MNFFKDVKEERCPVGLMSEMEQEQPPRVAPTVEPSKHPDYYWAQYTLMDPIVMFNFF